MTLRDVPDDVYQQLREFARRQGRSLNSYVNEILRATMELEARRRLMRETRAEDRRYRATLPFVGDSTELIREDRDSR
jgi:plasmid stability protein